MKKLLILLLSTFVLTNNAKSADIVFEKATIYLNASGIAVIDNSFIKNVSNNSSVYSMFVDKDTFTDEEIGENWVRLTVTDIHGNVDHCISILTVLDTFDRAINTFYSDSITSYSYVPNRFTPNNDEVNSLFTLVNSDYAIKNYEFSVYNLRSEMIFKTNFNSEGWYGNFRGVEIPEGDYVWTLTTSSKGGNNIQSQKRYIKLIR